MGIIIITGCCAVSGEMQLCHEEYKFTNYSSSDFSLLKPIRNRKWFSIYWRVIIEAVSFFFINDLCCMCEWRNSLRNVTQQLIWKLNDNLRVTWIRSLRSYIWYYNVCKINYQINLPIVSHKAVKGKRDVPRGFVIFRFCLTHRNFTTSWPSTKTKHSKNKQELVMLTFSFILSHKIPHAHRSRIQHATKIHCTHIINFVVSKQTSCSKTARGFSKLIPKVSIKTLLTGSFQVFHNRLKLCSRIYLCSFYELLLELS